MRDILSKKKSVSMLIIVLNNSLLVIEIRRSDYDTIAFLQKNESKAWIGDDNEVSDFLNYFQDFEVNEIRTEHLCGQLLTSSGLMPERAAGKQEWWGVWIMKKTMMKLLRTILIIWTNFLLYLIFQRVVI